MQYSTAQQNAQIILATLYPYPNVRIKQSMLDTLAESPEVTTLVQQFREDLNRLASRRKPEMAETSAEAEAAQSRALAPPAAQDTNDAVTTQKRGDTEGLEASIACASTEACAAGSPDPGPPATAAADDSGNEPPLTANAEKRAAPPLQPGEIPTTPAEQAPRQETTIKTLALSIPNGRAGQPYEADLAALCPELADCAELALEEDADTGLAIEAPARLVGQLAKSGTHHLTVRGRNAQGQPEIEATLKIAVIPNSRDLWKNLPADQNAPYPKAEGETDRRAAQPGWQLTVGSQRGRSHAHKGTHRDDHGAVAHLESGWNLLVIADGAGSCQFSREGSCLATTHAIEALRQTLNDQGASLEQALREWWQSGNRTTLPQPVIGPLSKTVIPAVHAGFKAITQEAEASGHPVKAFATTLLLAAHKPLAEGHFVVSFGIGDGAIAALPETGRAQLMNSPDSGEHAGQTRFLDKALFQDGDDLYRRLQVQVFPTLEALVLATDGVTDPKFDSDSDMHNGPSWWSLFEEIKPALPVTAKTGPEDPLLQYLHFFIERHHDDRTLAVLHRTTTDTIEEAPTTGEGHE